MRFRSLLLAAWLAAGPSLAFAQTNDPSLTQQDIDCLSRLSKSAAETCAVGAPPTPQPKPDTAAGATATGAPAESEAAVEASAAGTELELAGTDEPPQAGAVAMPALIVDLFPQPDPSAQPPAGTSQPAEPQPAADAAAAGAATTPPPPAGPIVSGPAIAAPRAITGAFVPDEVLVTVDGDAAVLTDIASTLGLQVRSQRTSALLGSTVARLGIPDGRPVGVVLAQLAADGRTRGRVANSIYDLQQAAGGAVNYAFQRIALAPDKVSGADVRVGVIDTAVDETHPALKGAVAGLFDAMPGVEITARDHATSVVGLIAGEGGMAPGAAIYHARAFEGGKSTTDIVIAALDWVAGQDVRVINMSFVGPPNDLLRAACEAARGRGILLVAAAGNNGPKAPYGYPAAYDGVIAVTATDAKDDLMPRANRGPYVFVSAPGVDMVAPVGGGTDLVTGTSFAAAIVTGAVANLLHAAPDRSAEQIEQALASTAKDLGRAGRDNDFGFGLLDVAAASKAR